MQPAQRALISVFDKRGVADFARALVGWGLEIVSTGGTFRHLHDAGIPVTQVSEITGFPEVLSGRVKTLHPRIHGGILADRSQPSHLRELEAHGIGAIDLVAVNLYPFRETAAAPGANFDEVIEMIDVGGPAMIRAAAKNFRSVGVIVDPDDYPRVLAALAAGGRTVPEPLRRELATKAFRHTQAYDAAITAWLEALWADAPDRFPPNLTVDLELELRPRYGENPHQEAAVYRLASGKGILGGMEQLQGKELSWNNLLDADAARRLVALFDVPAVVIVKHNNPCGVGVGDDVETAYRRAFECDPVSAFGSVIALNRAATGGFAEAMAELFVEVLVVPEVEEEAAARLEAKKNLRLLRCPLYRFDDVAELRAIEGGFLAQIPDGAAEDSALWTCPTQRAPSPEQRRALELAWKVARGVKSNAIVLANAQQTVGIGAGQMSRVDACRLAVEKAQQTVLGCVAASDAFFPFRDGLDVLADAGITAIVQPGGSKRDDEVITAADAHGIAMLFTGTRHFRH